MDSYHTGVCVYVCVSVSEPARKERGGGVEKQEINKTCPKDYIKGSYLYIL